MKHQLTAFAAAGALCLTMTACGNAAQTYTDYVQSVMDCTYQGKFDTYMELTDATTEEAQAVYDDEVEYISQLMRYNAAVEDDYVDESVIQGFDDLAVELMGKLQYTVEPAVRSGDTYHITISAQPVDFWDSAMEELEDLYDEFFSERFYTVAPESAEYEALEQEWGERALVIVEGHVAHTGYKDAQSVIVQINSDDDGNYGIDDKYWLDIDDILLDMDSNAG